MLGVLPLIQIGKYFQDSLQEVVSNLNLILNKFNSTKVVRVNHPTFGSKNYFRGWMDKQTDEQQV